MDAIRPSTLPLALLLLILPTPAEAAPPADDGTPRMRAQCRTLFGAATHRQENRARRQALLVEAAEESPGIIGITHSAPWRRPFYLELSGIELRSIETTDDGRQVARVEVNEGVGLDCPTGVYPVRADDSLGTAARVLKVFHDVVLVEFKGRLAYLLPPATPPPTWRMIWQSPWKIVRRHELGSIGPANNKANTRRKPPARNRKPRRR